MRKTLITFAIAAFASTTLVACGTETDIDTSLSSDEIVGERVPEGVEVVDSDIPIAYSHLAGSSAPDGVGVICAGEYAFLYTWNKEGYSGGSGATRFVEQDEFCANVQESQK